MVLPRVLSVPCASLVGMTRAAWKGHSLHHRTREACMPTALSDEGGLFDVHCRAQRAPPAVSFVQHP
jgi:hypothetical protein